MSGFRGAYAPRNPDMNGLTECDAISSGEVLADLDRFEACVVQQRTHWLTLIGADLQDQPTLRLQVLSRALDDLSDRLQAVGSGQQRLGRFPLGDRLLQ